MSSVLHFTLEDDGVIRARSQAGVEPTPDLLLEAEAACRTVRGDIRRPALWDITSLEKPKPQAWQGFIETAPKNLTAIAILGNEQQIALLGAFPQLINKLLIPLQIFDDEAEALSWLSRHV